MDFLSYFVWGEVADKTIEVVNQEIKFDDFIVKAKIADDNSKTPILTFKKEIKNCEKKEGFDLKQVYSDLYDYLVEKKIIDRKFSLFSFITFDSVDTINKDLAGEAKLKELKINEINEKPNLKCYNIDCKALSTLLTNYKYDPTDIADTKVFFAGGKRKNIKRKNKTKRKNRSRSSIKI
jgi:hypothetical protein